MSLCVLLWKTLDCMLTSITMINPVVPKLPIEELMKVNFRRLTTSHHGDL